MHNFNEMMNVITDAKTIQCVFLSFKNLINKNSTSKISKTTATCPISNPRLKPRSGVKIFCSFANINLAVFAKPIP